MQQSWSAGQYWTERLQRISRKAAGGSSSEADSSPALRRNKPSFPPICENSTGSSDPTKVTLAATSKRGPPCPESQAEGAGSKQPAPSYALLDVESSEEVPTTGPAAPVESTLLDRSLTPCREALGENGDLGFQLELNPDFSVLVEPESSAQGTSSETPPEKEFSLTVRE